MSKTADDLIYEAAAILGKNVAGESLGNVEYQTISAEVDNTIATISNIVYTNNDKLIIIYSTCIGRSSNNGTSWNRYCLCNY